jgi:hypothetical protein
MPITGGIPLPGSGIDAFLNALQTAQDNRLKQARLAESTRYHQYLNDYRDLQAQRLANKTASEQDLASRAFGSSSNNTNLSPIDNTNLSNMRPGDSYIIGSNQAPSGSQNQPLSGSSPSESAPNLQDRLDKGETITIRPGDPRQAGKNMFPGATIGGIKIPEVKTSIQDGVRYDTYPNGEVRAFKVGKSSDEKNQDKLNQKRAGDLIAGGNLLNKYSQNAVALSNLLSKKDVTGNIPALQNFLNLSGEDVGTFNENATPLVGSLAKDISQRGGAVVAKMAQAAKPQLSKSRAYNVGVLNSLHKQTYRSYQEAKQEYESITGKPYPIKLDKFYDKVKIISPKGHEAVVSQENADAAAREFPGTKIAGNIYGQD